MVEINWLEWIANQGFAIAVAFFLLIRIESKLDKLVKAIEELCREVNNARTQAFLMVDKRDPTTVGSG